MQSYEKIKQNIMPEDSSFPVKAMKQLIFQSLINGAILCIIIIL